MIVINNNNNNYVNNIVINYLSTHNYKFRNKIKTLVNWPAINFSNINISDLASSSRRTKVPSSC